MGKGGSNTGRTTAGKAITTVNVNVGLLSVVTELMAIRCMYGPVSSAGVQLIIVRACYR